MVAAVVAVGVAAAFGVREHVQVGELLAAVLAGVTRLHRALVELVLPLVVAVGVITAIARGQDTHTGELLSAVLAVEFVHSRSNLLWWIIILNHIH